MEKVSLLPAQRQVCLYMLLCHKQAFLLFMCGSAKMVTVQACSIIRILDLIKQTPHRRKILVMS